MDFIYVKADKQVWRVAAIVAALKKLKIQNHIAVLANNDLLLKHLSIAPIGNDKFVKVERLPIQHDYEFTVNTNVVCAFAKTLTLTEYASLSRHIGYFPIIGHDYGNMLIEANFDTEQTIADYKVIKGLVEDEAE